MMKERLVKHLKVEDVATMHSDWASDVTQSHSGLTAHFNDSGTKRMSTHSVLSFQATTSKVHV